MDISKDKLAANLSSVKRRIAEACRRAHRLPEEVALVAVTKSADVSAIKDLISLGHLDIGENRVQQLTQRAAELEAWRLERPSHRPQPRWHMVGRLQRNKVKSCLAAVDLLHSVDSLRLAEEISARAEREDRMAECLLEVNCSGDFHKGGVAVGAAMYLAEQISTLNGINLTGLMTMAPLAKDAEDVRFAFTRLCELFEEIRHEKIGGKDFRHLSMGMSNDFEVAIEEGATIVRIGTALFA
ncbi:MAG: YggS family pyridoxal phosphate-dependent enzyme [Planctomycetes bacterium]|nr:YggS family pyridoxal phosphate-dependent enzyme [Planctomycetota bacterium]